jgi:hypothetical protein
MDVPIKEAVLISHDAEAQNCCDGHQGELNICVGECVLPLSAAVLASARVSRLLQDVFSSTSSDGWQAAVDQAFCGVDCDTAIDFYMMVHGGHPWPTLAVHAPVDMQPSTSRLHGLLRLAARLDSEMAFKARNPLHPVSMEGYHRPSKAHQPRRSSCAVRGGLFPLCWHQDLHLLNRHVPPTLGLAAADCSISRAGHLKVTGPSPTPTSCPLHTKIRCMESPFVAPT